MMTKEIYNELIKWDSVLYNAHRINFVHLNNAEFSILKNIYEKYTNEKVTKSQLNCNSCRVKIVKKLAKDYLEYKEKELQEIKEYNETKETKENKETVKRGRPKKVNNKE